MRVVINRCLQKKQLLCQYPQDQPKGNKRLISLIDTVIAWIKMTQRSL